MFFRKKSETVAPVVPVSNPTRYTIKASPVEKSRDDIIRAVMDKNFTVKPSRGATQDFNDPSIRFGNFVGQSVSEQHINYFGSKGFPGYQALAIMAQHWLIDKACGIPCDDALRKGWELTKNDGKEFDNIDDIRRLDKRFNIRHQAAHFAKMGRVYGVRVAVFLVDNPDPDYYKSPFNIDAVKPGTYKGIIANDPYYVIPDVTQNGQDPNSKLFYEPEYWVIGGKKYHHSHCVVFRHAEVPQILKPTYIYGGLSLTQQIFEAVYNAEISANEVPMLLQNMRMDILKTDLEQAFMNPDLLSQRLGELRNIRTNYDTRLIGSEDDYTQISTALTGLDELVLGRYKIVASVAEMPVAKLLKTDLTGGLVKGGGEEAIYHETLESLQCKILPFLEKHYQLLLKSEFNYSDNIDIKFNKLDAMTEKELAEVNAIKANTASIYVSAGAIDGEDIRQTLIEDTQSGFNHLDINDLPEINDFDEGTKDYMSIKEINLAANEAATSVKNDLSEPSEAQIKSGNYKKGHINFNGINIAIENPKGSERKGVDKDGNEWQIKMNHHYGYIKKTEGNDGDHLDVFIGNNIEAENAYIVYQNNPDDGKFDEHKIMLGFDDEQSAKKAYLSNYSKDWKGFDKIKTMPIDEFKKWIKDEIIIEASDKGAMT